MKTILEGIDLLKNGTSIYIAPEGTRSKGDEILKFHEASFKLADKSKCPIVPVALMDSYKVFDTDSIAPVTVKLRYLKPLYYEDYKDMKTVDIAKYVKEQIEAKIKDLYHK